jgi:hypothetical protein
MNLDSLLLGAPIARWWDLDSPQGC